MISSAQTDVEPMLAARVGLEHGEAYIDRRVDLSPIATSALWLLGGRGSIGESADAQWASCSRAAHSRQPLVTAASR